MPKLLFLSEYIVPFRPVHIFEMLRVQIAEAAGMNGLVGLRPAFLFQRKYKFNGLFLATTSGLLCLKAYYYASYLDPGSTAPPMVIRRKIMGMYEEARVGLNSYSMNIAGHD